MPTTVNQYITEGCMRCKYGGTPKCKVHSWKEELEVLREIVLETGLHEEIKWGAPVYTHNGKNIVSVAALKNFATIGFFKGVLLSDKQQILQQQGNLQSDRIVKFSNVYDIIKNKDVLKSYIIEAKEIEKSGKKVIFKKNPESVPEELLQKFEENPIFKKAFYSLSQGRQRGYIIHFSQPKKSETRLSRINKSEENIFKGIGLNDMYKSQKP